MANEASLPPASGPDPAGTPQARPLLPSSIGVGGLGLALLAGLSTREAGFIALGALGFIALGLAWFWARIGLWRVRVEQRLTPTRAFPGDRLRWTLRLRNGKILPAHLTVRAPLSRLDGAGADVHTAPPPRLIGEAPDTIVVPLGPRASRELSVTLTPQRRGVYPLGPVQCTATDPWGFFARSRRIADPGLLWVYPRLYPLEGLPWSGRASTDGNPGGAGPWQHRLYPAGLRDTHTGSARDIDWRATARRQRLQIKEFDASRQAGIRVLLHLGSPATAAAAEGIELAISLAASLIWDRLQAGEPTGLVTGGRQAQERQVRTVSAFLRVLEALALLAPAPEHDWAELLARAGSRPPGVTPVIVSTGSLAPALADYAWQTRAMLLLAAGSPALAAGLRERSFSYRLADGCIVCSPGFRAEPTEGVGI